MTPHVDLSGLDFTIFAIYMVLSLAIGCWTGRHGRRNAKEYFLGDRGLPWYVVGTSMVAAVIKIGRAHV